MKSNILHDTFRIERTFDAPAERVFRAFADLETKTKWFGGPETWVTARRELDFRVGGKEVLSGGPPGGTPHTYEARYFDIVENRRIIYAYDMYVGAQKLSVSLATVELTPHGRRTHLSLTEQGAYLEGTEDGSERRAGTELLMDRLAASL
ncbi:MAG: polyketide cyclase [Myxococcales bacterium]|nr:MAG: polyketide cyclase [Myxococcales bacterium]